LDDVFLTRLYAAFDTNPNSKGVNFKEFIEGLSVFMKGTPDEKLERKWMLSLTGLSPPPPFSLFFVWSLDVWFNACHQTNKQEIVIPH